MHLLNQLTVIINNIMLVNSLNIMCIDNQLMLMCM